MNSAFSTGLRKLRAVVTRFDVTSNQAKRSMLKDLANSQLPTTRSLTEYADLLQFLQAFPPDQRTYTAAEKELARVEKFLRTAGRASSKVFINSGLPHTPYVSKFSHDACGWLLQDPDVRVRLDHVVDPEFDLNKVLAITLPTLERSETTSGFDNTELLRTLEVPAGREVHFLVEELDKLDHEPRIKDLLFDGLGLYLRMDPRNKRFSRYYNRIPTPTPFIHDRILKDFDHRELLDRPLGKPVLLDDRAKHGITQVVKRAMLVTDRETDPTTYLDERSLRLYDLERGVSVAIYGMVPARQLPLESYVGYTLFKNGIPAAYGGAWIFGQRADFGINIFEAFRGGESGYMLCQLLRVYRQVFHVERFEIEPYQFGLDNPDGIATGAFWFYHRYGFRPTDPKLLALSEVEFKKKLLRKDHRTSSRILLRFTESNMALTLSTIDQPGVYDIADQVKAMIRKRYKGKRAVAENECVKNFLISTGSPVDREPNSEQVLKEVALWAMATDQRNVGKLGLLLGMIRSKPVDLYDYQELLLRYFAK
ncbi:MAG: hypothetical protein JNL43_01140 [Flavobacteriales bacterium]|nr:hypothetical protein [Flavobacteriales bacterium]